MTATLSIDLRQLSGIDTSITNLKNASVDFSPHQAFVLNEAWVTRAIVRVKAPAGVATAELPPTPTGNAFEVQERGFRGARHGYVLVPDQDEVNYTDLVWVDPETLDPIAPPSPAWVADLEAAQADIATAQSTADAANTGLGNKVNTSTYTAGLSGKQDLATLLTDLAGLADTITDGQTLKWDETLGHLAAVNPVGAGRMAAAVNTTTTTTVLSAASGTNSGIGTTVAIPSTAISVGDSGGRPVVCRFGAGFSQTAVGAGGIILVLVETTGGASTTRAAYTTALPGASIPVQLGMWEFDIGVVTTTRTFELRAYLFTSAATMGGYITNTVANPTFLRAVAE